MSQSAVLAPSSIPFLTEGDCNETVLLAQQLLNREGALLDEDGQFGPETHAAVMACQSRHGLHPTGLIDAAAWTVLRALPEPCPGLDTRAVSFIAEEEINTPANYEAHYAHPQWPGEQSGVTIGIGYDLRFTMSLANEWGTHLPAESIAALHPWVGKTGSLAAVSSLAQVTVPWQAAWDVFVTHTLPDTLRQSRTAFPSLDELPPLSAGALVSLVYNRGADMTGPNRLEMRQIRSALLDKEPEIVPGYLRAMRRLWPNSPGLRARRDREADLFAQGLEEAAEDGIARGGTRLKA